jgi:DNA-binding NarL/FixJ family response regulator
MGIRNTYHQRLTPQIEEKVVKLINEGLTVKVIAERLNIGEYSVITARKKNASKIDKKAYKKNRFFIGD